MEYIFSFGWDLIGSWLMSETQDGSNWTPLMIAASLKAAEGDKIIDLLLRKGADVNVKSSSGQVCFSNELINKYVLEILTPR
jgi:ankyrin repeat protein